MNNIERLIKQYEAQPPRLSFGGSEGLGMKIRAFDQWPEEEAMKPLGGITLWRYRIAASPDVSPIRYYVVDVCLDVSGKYDPDTLPLPLEMQNHRLEIIVYMDHLDCARMRAIGGYSQ